MLGEHPEQAPDHRGAHLGVGLDADDDPADGPHDAVDGALESRHQPARPRPQTLPHPDRLDARLRRCSRSSITIVLLLLSESVLADSLTAIGFPICFYYGFTGVACAWYYRHELTESTRNFLLLGVGPVLGGLMLFGVGIKAAFYYGHTANVESRADPRHHAAAVDGHRRHAPRRDHHARLAPVLPRVLLAQDRNRAAGPARAAAADGARAGSPSTSEPARARASSARGPRRAALR